MSVLKITSENYEKEVTNSEIPVLLDFWASWCGPCKMLAPIVDDVAEEVKGQIKLGKVNVDEEMDLASKFKIMSIPTLVLIKNGEVETMSVGLKSKSEILEMIK